MAKGTKSPDEHSSNRAKAEYLLEHGTPEDIADGTATGWALLAVADELRDLRKAWQGAQLSFKSR